VLGIAADLLRTVPVAAFPRNWGAEPRRVCAQTTLAAELLDFIPRVPLIAGLARTIQFFNELEYAELPALARATSDD
jgi:hypothetical protein